MTVIPGGMSLERADAIASIVQLISNERVIPDAYVLRLAERLEVRVGEYFGYRRVPPQRQQRDGPRLRLVSPHSGGGSSRAIETKGEA